MELHARPSDMERRPIFHIASPSGWVGVAFKAGPVLLPPMVHVDLYNARQDYGILCRVAVVATPCTCHQRRLPTAACSSMTPMVPSSGVAATICFSST